MNRMKGFCLCLLALLAACSQVGEQPGGELETLGVITVGGGCSLVDAILAANTDSAVGGCPAGSGADTVVLEAGRAYLFSERYGPESALPTVSTEIVIEGNGAVLDRSSEFDVPTFRFIDVSAAGNLTLRNATLQYGTFYYDGSGGGLYNRGVATLENVTLRKNDAVNGGAILNRGTLVLRDSLIEENLAEGEGAGLWNSGYLVVSRTVIRSNTSYGYDGGGIYNSGQLHLEYTTVEGNTGLLGGGIYSEGHEPSLTVEHSLISDNKAYEGGGIYSSDYRNDVTVFNSTVSGNQATSAGGGISGSATLYHSTVANNRAPEHAAIDGSVEMSHTIVVDDADDNTTECAWLAGVTSLGYNLIYAADNTCTRPSRHDTVNVDPQLLPLADNGGLSQTHALAPASPAIGAGSGGTSSPPPYDQRGPGFDRVVAEVDIGAFESTFLTSPPDVGCEPWAIWGVLEQFALSFDDETCTLIPDPCFWQGCKVPPYIRLIPEWPCLTCELGLKFDDVTGPVTLVFSLPEFMNEPDMLNELFEVGLYTSQGEPVGEAELDHFGSLSGPEEPAPGYGLAIRTELQGEYLLRVEVNEQVAGEIGTVPFDITFLQE